MNYPIEEVPDETAEDGYDQKVKRHGPHGPTQSSSKSTYPSSLVLQLIDNINPKQYRKYYFFDI